MGTMLEATTSLKNSLFDATKGSATGELSARGRTGSGSKASDETSSSSDTADKVELSDRAKALLARAEVEQAVIAQLKKVFQPSQSSDQDGASQTTTDDPAQIFQSIADRLNKAAGAAHQGQTDTASKNTGATAWQNAAPYGDPNISDAAFFSEMNDSLLAIADFYDQQGRPPDVGQALRDAVRNGTVTIQRASDVPDLNFKSSQTFTKSVHGGGYDSFGSTSQNPTGATKEAMDSGRALAMWNYNRGDIYISW